MMATPVVPSQFAVGKNRIIHKPTTVGARQEELHAEVSPGSLAVPASSRTTRRASSLTRLVLVRGLALELLVAFAVVTAAFLDPLQTAIRVGRLVGFVLVETGMHPCFAGGFL
jgi:hypothetical protein